MNENDLEWLLYLAGSGLCAFLKTRADGWRETTILYMQMAG
jgi:hypothetical protein